MLAIGCGQTGTPLAPSLWLPNQVSDLTVNRVADRVTLTWTMPRRTTDKLVLKGPQSARVCRREDNGPCRIVANLSFPPEKPVEYDDPLPAELTAGSRRALAYSVEVLNTHGHSVGASNIAYTAAGVAPPPLVQAKGQASANGVVLRWQPSAVEGSADKVKIQRTLLSSGLSPASAQSVGKAKSRSGPGATATALVKEQTLVVPLSPGTDPGKALDADAAPDQRYSYRISRVATVAVAGQSIEIAGPATSDIPVDTKDIFPPAAPVGLAAVAAPEEGAIDLSWSPNTEADLAGYAVYRSEAQGTQVRISPPGSPLATPAFRDRTATPGHEYIYATTAIDHDGNESAHSAAARESLPPK